jgi:ATP-dependent Clp endopeptidase proteolytic subunit ClpP
MRSIFWGLLLAVALALPNDMLAAEPPPTPAAISISGPIDEDTVSSVTAAVASVKGAHPAKVVVRINSPGGSVGAGLVIIDQLRSLRQSGTETVCVVDNYAISMAATLLESPGCGERVVHAHSMVMFHGVAGEREGNQRAHQNGVEGFRAINRMAAVIVCERTGWSLEWYWQLVVEESRELWMVGEEALAYHVADRVIPVAATP